MKKFYLIALCAVISSVACAQSGSQFANKRLVSFTEESGNSKSKYVMEYDDQGRILKYASENGNRVHNYTYYGDDEILNDDGVEPITYKLSNGRLVWATIFFDCYTNCDIIYDGNKLKQIVDGLDIGDYSEYVWDGDNPTEYTFHASEGDIPFHATFTFNNISTHPLVHALFGLGEYFPSDLDEKLAVYPYLGELPKGLIENFSFTEDGDGPYSYNYTYELNGEGDVVKVTETKKSRTTIYTLEWENSGTGIETVKSDSPSNGVYYDLTGRKTASPTKGVFITNGRKVVIR